MLGEGEFLGQVGHRAADEPEADRARPAEGDGLQRDRGEPAAVHRRVMPGQHHAGAALQDAELAGQGAGSPVQAGRGDHVEHDRGRDLNAERPSGRTRRPHPVSTVTLPLTTR